MLKELLHQTKAYQCLDCGACTGSCPVSRVLPTFSPRLMVEKSLLGKNRDALLSQNLWSCLTCGQCASACPSEVDYLEFTRNLRTEALKMDNYGLFAHDGIMQTITKIQSLVTPRNKAEWAKEVGRIAEEGEYYYFVGCLPFFDIVFEYVNVHPLNPARNILKILNKMEIEPVISNDERCCGHDLFWSGDLDGFKKLASINIDLIKQKGCKKVIFACPEGYLTFKKYYPMFFGELGFEVIYFYEFILERLKNGGFELSKIPGLVTYHDPCRLGRFLGIYDAPREIIRSIPGLNFVEMKRNRKNSICCGTTGWVNCSSSSKEIQVEKLMEAMATGASTLVTTCPKCQIHLSCALLGSEFKIDVKDLSGLLAEAIGV